MIDDQIRLAAHTKPAFLCRAWVIAYLEAYLEGKRCNWFLAGRFTPTSVLRKDQIT